MQKTIIRTVGCFLQYKNTFLILHRQPHKADGDMWGLPAGKVELGETDEQTILLELAEETGYHATKDQLEFLGQYDWDFPEFYLEFPTYRITLDTLIDISHQPDEHSEYRWVTAQECYSMTNLIRGFHQLLELTGHVPINK